MEAVIQALYEAVIEGEQVTVKEQVTKAIAEGIEPGIILNRGMITAMAEVGRRFEEGDYFVPEMLMAARAMQAGMGLLKPYLLQADIQPAGKIVIGTVKGDLHDIGKNLVAMMLEGSGFDITDLGTDVPPEKFIAAVEATNAPLVAMSALLTTTMPLMKKTIEAFEATGLRGQVKIMVGGAPVTQNYAEAIGADGYAPDASRAATLAKRLLGVEA